VRGGNLISSLLIFVQILPTIMTRVADDKLDIANGATKQKKAGAIGEIVHPVERGMITDWDAMEDLWHYVFYTGLNWEAGNEGQLLITEPLLTPKVVFCFCLCILSHCSCFFLSPLLCSQVFESFCDCSISCCAY
jgi:actin-related protein